MIGISEMSTRFALVLCLALPLAAFADGLATSICVLEENQFANLVRKEGDITRVAIGDVWNSSLKTHIIGKAPDKTANLEFAQGGKQFRLWATEMEDKTIYAILNITDKAREILVASGEIAKGKETKETVIGEPFVVVVRTGNFLKQ
jgi:hypothetical protein